jgi:hypothetical protein
MPNINDRIGSQNVIRVLSNASAPPTRLVNLTDVDSTLKTRDGMILVWDVATESFYMTDTIDSSTLIITGIATFSNTTNSTAPTNGALIVSGGLGVAKHVNIGEGFTVAGVSTFASDLDINAAVDILNGVTANSTFESVGITTLASAGGITTTGGDLYVGADLYISDDLVLDEFTARNGNITGIATVGTALDVNGTLDVDGKTELDITNIAETLNVVGIATFSNNIDANGDLDVDGRTELDITNISETLNVTGIATFANNIDANGDLDVDGRTELDTTNISETLNVVGISTFEDRVIFDSTNSIQIPVGSTAQRDSVGTAVTGQIRYNTDTTSFEGYGPGGDWGSLGGVKDVDGDTFILAESTPGSDEDALTFTTAGTEKAVIDSTGNLGIGTTNPASKLDVRGNVAFGDDVVFETANTNNIVFDKSANDLTFGDNTTAKFGSGGDLNIYHNGTNSYIDNNTGPLYIRNNVDDDDGSNIIIEAKSGKASAVFQDDEGVRLYYDDAQKFETTANGINVTGHVETDTLNVSGVSTFVGNASFTSNVSIAGTLTYEDVTNVDAVGLITARSGIHVGHPSIGSTLTPGGDLLMSRNLRVAGVSTFVGVGTFQNDLYVGGDLYVADDITIDELNVRDANITGIATIATLLDVTGHAELDTLNVSGVSTFVGIATFSNNVFVVGTLDAGLIDGGEF